MAEIKGTYFNKLAPICYTCKQQIVENTWIYKDNINALPATYHIKCIGTAPDLTPEQSQHLMEIQRDFQKLVCAKYLKGVVEHGGNLWEKFGLIDEALNEVADLYTYLYTLKQQLIARDIKI